MRKRTRRKVYPLFNPISYAIEGAAFTTERDLDKLRMLELTAIDQFAHGTATVRQWQDITDMLNLCETMAKQGIGPEALEACQRAQAALVEAAARYERTRRMGTTGEGLKAMRDLYEYHDLQRQSISRSEYESAIRVTSNRIRSKAPEVVAL